MKAIIKTSMVGMHFGTVGVVYAVTARGKRGRKLGETRVYPYGFDCPARDAAESLAVRLGAEVVS